MKSKYQISADDTYITKLAQSCLMSLTISDKIGLVSDTMTLELDDRDSAFVLPAFGAVLDVVLDDELFPMGKFVADEIEPKTAPQ